MIPSSIYHVDTNVSHLHIQETGRISAPFHTIQQAIDDAHSIGLLNIEVLVSAGTYPEPINIPAHMVVIVKGPISGICILGNVTFHAAGSFNPIIGLGTACSFNDVIIQNVEFFDGYAGYPASNSVFITQNSSVVGDISQTGDSMISIFFAGIGTANAVLTGIVQSSQVLGSIDLPHCNISATNTSFGSTINAHQIYCSGCDLAEAATSASGIELHQCIIDGDLTGNQIYLDDISFNQVISKNIKVSVLPTLLGSNNITKITHVHRDYQVLIDDQFVVVRNAHGPVTVTLPATPYVGLQFKIAAYNSSNVSIVDATKRINGQNRITIPNKYDQILTTYIGNNEWLAK